MSDLVYRWVRRLGTPPLWIGARAVRLNVDRVPSTGPFILAPSHASPFDIPCLIRSCPRPLDFLSIVEMQRKPLVGPFYKAMNCVFVDRQRHDRTAVRALRDRLASGRVVAMFPEGNIRAPADSVTNGGSFKPGVIKLARQSNVSIVPCVLLNNDRYRRATAWLPFQRWSYGINFGEPIDCGCDDATNRLKAAYVSLAAELRRSIVNESA